LTIHKSLYKYLIRYNSFMQIGHTNLKINNPGTYTEYAGAGKFLTDNRFPQKYILQPPNSQYSHLPSHHPHKHTYPTLSRFAHLSFQFKGKISMVHLLRYRFEQICWHQTIPAPVSARCGKSHGVYTASESQWAFLRTPKLSCG
jgi:hypothetical protein